jgi:hypothetical protein
MLLDLATATCYICAGGPLATSNPYPIYQSRFHLLATTCLLGEKKKKKNPSLWECHDHLR